VTRQAPTSTFDNDVGETVRQKSSSSSVSSRRSAASPRCFGPAAARSRSSATW